MTEDEALVRARESSSRTIMPLADVSPLQGAFLAVIARLSGARRALEFGTLAGYSTIWLARALGPEGKVVTFEIRSIWSSSTPTSPTIRSISRPLSP